MATVEKRNHERKAVAALTASAAKLGASPDVVTFAERELGFRGDEEQKRVLASETRRGILNCCRQWGKTTLIALKAVHRAYTRPGSLVVVAAPSERQTAEFLRRAREFLIRLKIKPRGDGDNQTSLLLPNGSRIVGLPATEYSVRGLSAVSLLIFDEAARVPDQLYKALRPMMATTEADLWLMSTPYGRRGFFYEAWEHGGEGWQRFAVKATDCGRISREFLMEERRELGNLWFRQEYLCEFVDNGGSLFERDAVERALRSDVEPLVGERE